MTTRQLAQFFKYADGQKVYGLSIRFTPHTYLWIDERYPAVNMLFTERDYEIFETKYGTLKDDMFIIFDKNKTTFEFEKEKRGKLKYIFYMD